VVLPLTWPAKEAAHIEYIVLTHPPHRSKESAELQLLKPVPAGTAYSNLSQQHKSWKPVVPPLPRMTKDATNIDHNAHSPVNVWVKEAPGVYSLPHG
jgi:hypothetical protein